MANYLREVLNDITPYIYNPNILQTKILDTLRSGVTGEDIEILDPNNPFVFALEASVVTAIASIENHEQCLRKSYAAMATDYNELYQHMSDKDFLDRFAEPSTITMHILVGKDELKARAIPLNSKDVRKLIIPRDTEVVIAGYAFTMQYPIELRVMPHGGIQVVYDTTVASPIRTVASNTLDWSIVTIPYNGVNLEFIDIQVPMMQYKIDTFTDMITSGTGFNRQYRFSNNFYYARVFLRNGTAWNEIKTTHSEQVIDPLVPMARLTVTDGQLGVYIPDVYIRSGLAAGDVRVDVYSTNGKLDLDLRRYEFGEYVRNWRDIGKEADSSFVSPLTAFTYLSIFSAEISRGGRAGLSFLELRDRCINNTLGQQVIPVSDLQLESVLTDLGYQVTKSIDFVTDRIYHASIGMPESTFKDVSTPIGTANGIMETTFDKLTQLPTVMNNGNRITLLPSTIYVEKDGLIYVDAVGSVEAYRRLPVNERVVTANASNLLFTPFHYVLDTNSDMFEARAYYLSAPKIASKQFVETNVTLAIDIGTGSYSLEQTDTGYRLYIVTRSDATYKSIDDANVFCQISFTPRGYTEEYAYLDGTLAGYNETERVFQFDITTNVDIDKNHDLVVTNFTMLGDEPTDIPLQLDGSLNVIYGVRNYTTADYKQSAIDKVLVSDDTASKGLTHERLVLNLGTHLPTLWSNARTVVGSTEYLRYEEDVYAYYESDVYERNPTTGVPIYSIVAGKVLFNVLHSKGDPVLADGQPVLKYAKGDVMLGYDGNPIVKNARTIRRRIELYLFDGRYAISDTADTQTYMAKVITAMLQYITEDIPSIDADLLEKTKIYLYPKTNLGLIDVKLGDGTIAKVDAENRFKVRYYLTTAARRNGQLLTALGETTRSSILSNLKLQTVSTSAITTDIRAKVGDEIVDVEMDGMGVDEDQFIFTVQDSTAKATLGKKLIANADWTVGIVDDISISYTKHDIA